jgi:hypothetical protein
MSSALMNRMVHVNLRASQRDWLAWAYDNCIHPWIVDYIRLRPDHLWVQPPKTEEPFSTPRSWHMLSDALNEFGEDVGEDMLDALACGCLSAAHAGQFKAFVKQVRNRYALSSLLKGEMKWPDRPEDRDLLYFLAQSFRAHLIKELPAQNEGLSLNGKELSYNAKGLIKQLASISLEIAQMVVARDDADPNGLPDWFVIEIARDLPRIIVK